MLERIGGQVMSYILPAGYLDAISKQLASHILPASHLDAISKQLASHILPASHLDAISKQLASYSPMAGMLERIGGQVMSYNLPASHLDAISKQLANYNPVIARLGPITSTLPYFDYAVAQFSRSMSAHLKLFNASVTRRILHEVDVRIGEATGKSDPLPTHTAYSAAFSILGDAPAPVDQGAPRLPTEDEVAEALDQNWVAIRVRKIYAALSGLSPQSQASIAGAMIAIFMLELTVIYHFEPEWIKTLNDIASTPLGMLGAVLGFLAFVSED
jgi:hypothetical protein